MKFLPLDRMWDRIEVARGDSDTELFNSLMYLGEMVTKLVTAGLVAGIEDGRDRHQYRQLYRLVRADGIGDWSQVIDDVLTGPASQNLDSVVQTEQRELTQKSVSGTWQYEAVELIHKCLKLVEWKCEDLQTKVDARKWFNLFAQLRNKTRGHGAVPGETYSKMCPHLELSIRLLIDNHEIFKRPWVFLRRSLSGKYRVTKWTEAAQIFEDLKTNKGINAKFDDGLYIQLSRPFKVPLIETTIDALDFFFPNGGFNNKKYELISYITGEKLEAGADPYNIPAGILPDSQTQGLGKLDPHGNCFVNLPPKPTAYVHRQMLEEQLTAILSNDRHPVITLVGRGGIGKTSLALTVLHHLTQVKRFDVIVWFSARDVDLLTEGPKLVRPHVLNQRDIAKEFVQLMEPAEATDKKFSALDYMQTALGKSPLGGSILFVFDNFETVTSTVELYNWIDTYIRLPNKVLITSRYRDFKGDYPVEVLGMSESECQELVDATAANLGISDLLTTQYWHEIYNESDGHPYVVKMLLGEVAKAGRLVKVERVVASKDELLEALFERTFSGLSKVAQRVFFTLCNWRSTVPQLAVEAVLLRPSNDRMDVEAAIEELRRSSFIEVTTSKEDNTVFLTVPLVASLFGARKLAVSPEKSAVEADTELLQTFGAAQPVDVQAGIAPRIDRMFREIAMRVARGNEKLTDHIPMLEFLARRYPPAWLLLARLYEEIIYDLESAKTALRRYLEMPDKRPDFNSVWKKLADLCVKTDDIPGELHALVERCELAGISFSVVVSTADKIMKAARQQPPPIDTYEKQILIRRILPILEARVDEADAEDFGQIAWLHVHLDEFDIARDYTKRGLYYDPESDKLQNLARRLGI